MPISEPIGGEALSIHDLASIRNGDGPYMEIVEILNRDNPIMQDLMMVEANQGTHHIGALRTSLPRGTYRAFYQGVATEKSTVTQISESCSMLEVYGSTDARLIDMYDKAAKGSIMVKENRAYIEGLGQTQADVIFYGNNKANPNQYDGLSNRYNTYGTDKQHSSYNVIDAGGTGVDLTSIWVVNWGSDRIHGIYPSGSVAGIKHEDLGKQLTRDSNGLQFTSYVSHYMWDMGLFVADWRWAVRIANVDVTALAGAGTASYAGPEIGLLLWDALEKLPNRSASGCNLYCAPKVWTAIMKLAMSKSNLALSLKDWNGQVLPTINNVPIKVCDAISEHEQLVQER